MKNEILENDLDMEIGCNPPPDVIHYFRAFSVLQEKWVLFILHILMVDGAHGFNELSRKSMGVNTTTLSQRLTLLEKAGLIKRTVQSTIPPKTSYELTQAGFALEPVFQAIGKWSAEHLDENIDCGFSSKLKPD